MPEVQTSVTDGVATITLNRPDRRNALTHELVDEFVAAIDTVEADPATRAIVVTGAGSAFCAGADLGALHGADEATLRGIYASFLRVSRITLPTIAAVNGPAVGAGMNLALACDVRIAAGSARFDARFLRVGLHPGGGHGWLLRRAVGPSAAAAIVLFGEVLDGARAEAVGLAWRCVADAEVVAYSTALAARLAGTPRELLTRTKATLAGTAAVRDHAEAVELELDQQLWSLGQSRFAAGSTGSAGSAA
ncbi:enoyl-CoA hydratase [Polymorphospora sp. NPDC050346]|uniref:enoyl-CoA hydratase n=1 Tax=Polymorphospora sp. NPDC050346 TaxID=3155780 RepID=UPI0033E5C4D4